MPSGVIPQPACAERAARIEGLVQNGEIAGRATGWPVCRWRRERSPSAPLSWTRRRWRSPRLISILLPAWAISVALRSGGAVTAGTEITSAGSGMPEKSRRQVAGSTIPSRAVRPGPGSCVRRLGPRTEDVIDRQPVVGHGIELLLNVADRRDNHAGSRMRGSSGKRDHLQF